MKVETEALLQQGSAALLQQSNERIAALLAQWFELMIGDEGMDEELDDLCLLLDYHVRSWGAQVSYATYTSWWEVEGYLEPSEGMFICADVAALRQRLLDMPVKQFDLVIELAYQARSMVAELEGEPCLPTGQVLLREMAVWLADAAPLSDISPMLRHAAIRRACLDSPSDRSRSKGYWPRTWSRLHGRWWPCGQRL